MTFYYTKRGGWHAESESDLVSQMHTASFAPEPDDGTWMLKTAARVELFLSEVSIRFDNPPNFVHDLIEAGLLFVGERE